MRYLGTAMRRVTWKSRGNDEKVTYKSRVKRKVFHFLFLPSFLIKILLVGYILLYIIYKITNNCIFPSIDPYPKPHLHYRLCARYLDTP